MAVGGWTPFRFLTEEDYILFCKATQKLYGVKYEPVLVSTQMVAGTNYAFICNATTTTNPPMNYIAKVTIYQPLYYGENTAPQITDICKMICEPKL